MGSSKTRWRNQRLAERLQDVELQLGVIMRAREYAGRRKVAWKPCLRRVIAFQGREKTRDHVKALIRIWFDQ